MFKTPRCPDELAITPFSSSNVPAVSKSTYAICGSLCQVVQPGRTHKVLKHLGTGRLQGVHVLCMRVITPQDFSVLLESWRKRVGNKASMLLLDPDYRTRDIREFWQEVVQPPGEALKGKELRIKGNE